MAMDEDIQSMARYVRNYRVVGEIPQREDVHVHEANDHQDNPGNIVRPDDTQGADITLMPQNIIANGFNTTGYVAWAGGNGGGGGGAVTTNQHMVLTYDENSNAIWKPANTVPVPDVTEPDAVQEELPFLDADFDMIMQTEEGIPCRRVRCRRCGEHVDMLFNANSTQWYPAKSHREIQRFFKPEEMNKEMDLCLRSQGEYTWYINGTVGVDPAANYVRLAT
jgi:hypothetical protein